MCILRVMETYKVHKPTKTIFAVSFLIRNCQRKYHGGWIGFASSGLTFSLLSRTLYSSRMVMSLNGIK